MKDMDKTAANLTKRRRERAKFLKIGNENRETTTNTKIQGIIRTTLKIYIQINWKIWMKWKNF
jgi:hypothetical protein